MLRHHASRLDATPATLRRVWAGTILKLLVVTLVVGSIVLVTVQYQRVTLRASTQEAERTMGAQVALHRALLGINGPPAIGMLYGTGENLAPADLRAGYERTRTKINIAFDAAELVMTDSHDVLQRARRSWQGLDAAVLAAPELVSSGALQQALAEGRDPHERTVWAPYNAISTDLAQLGTNNVNGLRQRAEIQERTQLLIVPLVLTSVFAGLLVSWRAARRVKREVFAPILELRRAALAMRESRLDYVVELNGGTVELRDLAATLNDTAVALAATHRVLHDQAHTDALTGLPNRKAFAEHLRNKLAEPGDRRIGVLFVDVDDFKDVNDTLGHAAGDELLSVLARRLRAGTRGDEFVARLGGDEFAVIVDCGDRPGEALIVAERAVAVLAEPVKIGETTATVSCSVGIATSDADATPDAADELVRNADFAMYMAKSQGKNCFEMFAPSMHTDMLARMELKRDLAQAVELDQLVLHYQPVVDLNTGALQGFEALIRWQHPTRGLLAPGEFIALAEDTGDIIEVGTWVLDQACGYLAALRQDVPGGSTLQMAINLSAHQITAPGFTDTVTKAIDRHGVPAAALILEITEAVALTNTKVAVDVLTELRNHGVRIALDDFGVGYSSLRYLHELPVDVIKIDRSFVMDQQGDTDSMLRAIVTLGQSLGLEIIAEGIENPSELDRLRRFDRLAGQGYLFGRPTPGADATVFARTNTICRIQPQVNATASVTAAT